MNTIPDIIMSKITFGDCWIWNGQKDSSGYPRIFIGNGYEKVSRLVYEAVLGHKPIKRLNKTCTNRSCVNPKHTLQHQFITGEDIIKLGDMIREKSEKRTN